MSDHEWPNDADGDVLRRMSQQGFDFARPCVVDFNVDFEDWPPDPRALQILEASYPGTKMYLSDDGGGYVQFQVEALLTYALVVTTQRAVSESMAQFDGVCESWGVLH